MKKFIFMLFAVAAVCGAQAQPPRGMMPPPPGMMPQAAPSDRSIAQRYEHLREALQMDEEQFEKFAPVYQSYQREIRGIRKDLKTFMDSYKGEKIDHKTAYRMAMAQLNADEEVIRCKKEYLRVFKDYLTPEQMSIIFLVERPRHKPQQQGERGGEPQPPMPPQQPQQPQQ